MHHHLMTPRTRLSILFLPFVIAACGGTNTPDTRTDRLKPSDEAMRNGSCKDSCGDVSTDGCYCDDLCERIGDCCPDYSQICQVACPAVEILCKDGFRQADTNGDGCIDGCEPIACPEIAILCDEGSAPFDSDGDGCVDTCEPVPCLPVEILCEEDSRPVDTDGDGCLDTCGPSNCDYILDCAPGFKPAHTDGDGCPDECIPICDLVVDCWPGHRPIDRDGDGCIDACDPGVCVPGTPNCPPPVCLDPERPDVHYIGNSDEDPSICARILFACEEGQRPFSDLECGCGCVDEAAVCLAFPVCEFGERQVASPDQCPGDASCRKHSICGHTIWCVSGGLCDDLPPPPNCARDKVLVDSDGDGCLDVCR